MTVILSGIRSDGTPLVLVRCDHCERLVWFDLLPPPLASPV
jgi:hypothetical protein